MKTTSNVYFTKGCFNSTEQATEWHTEEQTLYTQTVDKEKKSFSLETCVNLTWLRFLGLDCLQQTRAQWYACYFLFLWVTQAGSIVLQSWHKTTFLWTWSIGIWWMAGCCCVLHVIPLGSCSIASPFQKVWDFLSPAVIDIDFLCWVRYSSHPA